MGKWKIRQSTQVYDNPWISVVHHDVVNPSGQAGIYGKVHYKNLAVGVIPYDEKTGFLYLVRQHRFVLKATSLEIPEGGSPIGNDPLNDAKRELKEETGIKARRWEKLLEMHLSNSVSDEKAIVYLATGLTFGTPCPEDTEDLRVERMRWQKAYELVLKGKITDSMTVAALLRFKILQMEKELNG
jgi:8-oxo-dGTP pyrophosphatase MutT (NUDIX family)